MTAATLSVALLWALAGCTTSEPPEPTPTSPFANEEEAFAAAEETYRAYASAENARRDDPAAPDPQVFLTGDALENDIDGQRRFAELGVHLVGPSEVTSFEAQTASRDNSTVAAIVCLDSTAARLVDDAGTDVTPEERDATLALEVSLKYVGGTFLIVDSDISEDHSC